MLHFESIRWDRKKWDLGLIKMPEHTGLQHWCVRFTKINQAASNQHFGDTFAPFAPIEIRHVYKQTPVYSSHTDQNTKSHPVQCTGMQTHICTNTNRHASESGRLLPLQCLFLCGWPIPMGGLSKPFLIHLISWTQEPGLQTKSSFTHAVGAYSYMWSQESVHHKTLFCSPPPSCPCCLCSGLNW